MLTKAFALSSLFLALAAGGVWGWVGFTAVFLLVTITAGTYLLETHGKVTIPELSVGVVYRTKGEQFARFLEPGTHRLNPFSETLGASISTAGQSSSGQTKNIQAIGGLTVNSDWSVAYTLRPQKIATAKRPKLARALPSKAENIIRQQISNILHHVIGEYTLEQLSEPGTHRRLERQVRQMARMRLEPLGFELNNFMLDALHLPAHIRATLEAAHERAMQAEQEARALARLQQVISQFSDADMARLIELERIQRMGQMGQMGLAMVYPTLTEPQGGKFGGWLGGVGGGGVGGQHGRVVIPN
jgi:regulator of protease activity HflC (stomatin/prohibitin superfamily)